jgi:hypothetical protein
MAIWKVVGELIIRVVEVEHDARVIHLQIRRGLEIDIPATQ